MLVRKKDNNDLAVVEILGFGSKPKPLPDGETKSLADLLPKAILVKSDNLKLTWSVYSGGKLNLECYGTAQNEITFNIVLEGENIVNADDIGIDFSYDGKINFSGNGNLTINASKPISYENYEKQMYISPSENIYKQGKDSVQSSSTDTQTTGEIIENDNDDEMPVEGMVKEPSNYNSNDLVYSIICIYIVVSLTLIIFLIIKVKKLQKNNK